MPSSHTVLETDKCKIKVHSDGGVSIECGDKDTLYIGKQEVKMIDGLSNLATANHFDPEKSE